MPRSLHILETSFFVLWLFRMTKIIFYVCLLTHFARQDRQNGNLKNKQNHATKVTKIQKKKKLQKLHEPNNSLLRILEYLNKYINSINIDKSAYLLH
jgi:hypothetical protein